MFYIFMKVRKLQSDTIRGAELYSTQTIVSLLPFSPHEIQTRTKSNLHTKLLFEISPTHVFINALLCSGMIVTRIILPIANAPRIFP